jgi:hypothetical protein
LSPMPLLGNFSSSFFDGRMKATEHLTSPLWESILEGIFGRSALQRSKRQGWVDTDHLWITALGKYPNVGIDLPDFL